MKKEVEKIGSEIKISSEKSKEILNTISHILVAEKTWEDLSRVTVDDEEDEASMVLAKANRLSIKNQRLEAEKFIDSKRKEVQEQMAEFTAEDKTWLKIKQLVIERAKGYESTLEEQEKFAENIRKAREAKLKTERTEMLQPYCEDPSIYPLEVMAESAFKQLLSALKLQHEENIRAEEEAYAQMERDREEKERKESLQKERSAKMLPLLVPGKTVTEDWSELSEKEFIKKLDEAKSIFKAYQKEVEEGRIAREKLRQKELAEAEAEKKKEKELAEAEATKKALAKAPAKEKLMAFLDTFDYDTEPLDSLKDKGAIAMATEIKTKFSGFKKWAKTLIESL